MIAQSLRTWTLSEAQRAAPYVRACLSEVRDRWIEIQLTEDGPWLDYLRGQFAGAMKELQAIHVEVTAVLGTAMFCADVNGNMAWLVFDLHKGFVGWRWHTDSLDQRRPLRTFKG